MKFLTMHITNQKLRFDIYIYIYIYIYMVGNLQNIVMQGSKLTFLLGSTGAPNFLKLGAPKNF